MPVKILRELRMKVREPIAVQEEDGPAVENLPQGETPIVDLEGRLIDLNPSDDGKYKTQGEWIAYFNDRNEMMVSMPDVYMAGKSGSQALLESLRKDVHDRWIVTSTRIIYNNNQDARIIHNYGNNLVQSVEHSVVIPEYWRHPLEDILNTQEGLRYLQALFGTNDDAKEIKDALHKLSDYAANKTRVWSVVLSVRPASRAAGFDCIGGGFRVLGGGNLYANGRSRGVRYASDSER